MTASPTHPRTGEPETEAGRRLLSGHGHFPELGDEGGGEDDRWCAADDEPWPCPFATGILAIEAEAAKRERDRISEAVGRLPGHDHDAGSFGSVRFVTYDAVVSAIGTDPVPDEPPGVATEEWGK